MKFAIKHEIKGRIRIHLAQKRMTYRQADILQCYLEDYSEVLPEDKASFVEKEKGLGNKVIMIGDGINDSLALSSASVGIAISDGAAIAREIADVTISADNLHEIVTLKRLSTALMKRIHNNYRTIIGVNVWSAYIY